MPSSTRKEQRDGTITESNTKSSRREIRFFCSTPKKLFGEGKLKSKWQGPYTVINTSPHGVITIQDDDSNIFKVKGQRLKVFLEPSYNTNLEIDRIDLIAFDKFIQNS